jgi:hypothetical protein
MPLGTGRPYTKPERAIAAANKTLRRSPKNRSMNEADMSASNAPRGRVMGLSDPANFASETAREYGRSYDEDAARRLRSTFDERSKYAK